MSATESKSLIEISEDETLVRFSVDLVAAARRNLGFLRLVNDSHWLHDKPTILEAIRRYDELWMPLISDLGKDSKAPTILPPIDVEWVWFCHTLNPASYRQYCESKFSKLIGKAAIFDEENEEYALDRCREIWEVKYPSESFDNEADSSIECHSSTWSENLLDQVLKQRDLCRVFCEPYYAEIVYLIAAKQRYKGFVYMIHKFANGSSCLVPTSDVLLMWLTHKSYPTIYALDVKELEGDLEKIVGVLEAVKEEYIKETKIMWEKTFDQPYEKAGAAAAESPMCNETPFYWDVTDSDFNTRYKSLVPRFMFEVSVALKLISNTTKPKRDLSREFLRIRMMKRHRELKIDKPMSNFTSKTWQEVLHLYCEFGTKGMTFDLRQRGGGFLKGSNLIESLSFSWNELLRAPTLTLGKDFDQSVRTMASITPPIQAPYLFKSVPDRVTDDSGAMVSDVILKMNQYRPQEGRWLSRTVLDHAGRECFVVRMRVGAGLWRRGGEVPKAVKWEERIIEIREGSWSYVTGSCSIGRSPEKVVGTATPKEPPEGHQACWSFSSGNVLLIQWASSTSISGLKFHLGNENSSEAVVELLQGRQLQYQIKKTTLGTSKGRQTKEGNMEEDEFVTLIRYSEENPNGKATALLNWKLLVVEILPEEDAAFVLLICMSILRSVTEMRREDIGNLLARRRVSEAKIGERDWGSVILHPSSCSESVSSPYLHPWYWDANAVMMSQVKDQIVNTSASNYSQAEGGDKLYKSAIVP